MTFDSKNEVDLRVKSKEVVLMQNALEQLVHKISQLFQSECSAH